MPPTSPASFRNAFPSDRARHRCHVRVFDVVLTVAVPPSLAPAVERLLSAWRCATSDTPAAILVVDESRGSEGAPAYTLHAGGQVLASAPDRERAVVALQHWIDGEVVARAGRLTPVHAGVVAWRHRAVVLPGPSGTGKTSLVRSLLERGAVYYSDELAFLEADGRVRPYPRHLMVRGDDGLARAVPADILGAGIGSEAQPISLILDVRFSVDGLVRLEPMTCSEALLLLLANTPHRLSSARAVPKALRSAAASGRAYRGTRGCAAEAASAILHLAELMTP